MLEQYKALISDTKYDVTLLSNTAAFLYHNLPNINWAGFYLLHHDTLYLGPFVGKVACELITVGKGVCGTCVQLSQTMRVENVHQFDGHIACDPDSNSEIVIPLKLHNQLVGVLDIDSTVVNNFNHHDQAMLEALCQILEQAWLHCELRSLYHKKTPSGVL